MDETHLAKLIKMEEKQNADIQNLAHHEAEDHRILGDIKKDIKDIYGKLSDIRVEQTRLATIFWIIGSLVVLLTPVITALVVALMMRD